MTRRFVHAFLFCAFLPAGLAAEIAVNPLFADHAVLQRDMPVPVWGTGTEGETVTVTLDGKSATGTVKNGTWRVILPARKAGGPFVLRIKGANEIVLQDILVGEVWLCAGQSNMEWALARSTGGAEAITAATNDNLRMCRIPHNAKLAPERSVAAKWERMTPSSAKNFSAIPYWFGEKLQRRLGVPVGIVNNAFGGTTIQAWMSAETLAAGTWPKDKWSDGSIAKAEFDKLVEKMRPVKEKYDRERAEAASNGKPAPPVPSGIPGEYKGPSTMWNGEIVPLLPLALRGVAWYQGENNAYVGISDNYADSLTALLKEWRKGFGREDLPFVIFQVARNRKWQADPGESTGIAVLQEAQRKVALRTTNATLVVTTDKGENDVHYAGKEPIAERGVRAAFHLAYGGAEEHMGPLPVEFRFAEGKARVRFSHAEGGLVAEGGKPTGFVLAGSDGKFHFAEAEIQGDAVIVESASVSDPKVVRYGWADMPKVNLFNARGLPAASFRSDEAKD